MTLGEVESGLLNAMLRDASALKEIRGSVAPEDFTDARNRQVFETMLTLSAEGKGIDGPSVKERLPELGDHIDAVIGAEVEGRVDVSNLASTIHWNAIYRREKAERERRETYPVRTVKELASTARPKEYIVQGKLARKDFCTASGLPGSKKTLTAIDLSVCVASGKPWLGHEVTQGRVLFIDLESGADRLAERIKGAMAAHGVEDIPLGIVSETPINIFRDKRGKEKLSATIKHFEAALVIIDCLTPLLGDADENSSSDMKDILYGLRTIAHENNCAIWLIHHLGKSGSYRGSSVLDGCVDLMFKVDSKDGSPIITFSSTKTRDRLKFKPFRAELVFRGEEWMLIATESSGKAQSAPDSRTLILEHLKVNGASKSKDIVSALEGDFREGTVHWAIAELCKAGKVRKLTRGEYEIIDNVIPISSKMEGIT